jgi:hypothetical protein
MLIIQFCAVAESVTGPSSLLREGWAVVDRRTKMRFLYAIDFFSESAPGFFIALTWYNHASEVDNVATQHFEHVDRRS